MAELSMKLSNELEQMIKEDVRESLANLLDEIKAGNAYPEYMSVEQTAKYVNVSRSTIDKWIKHRGLPTINVGGTTRIKRIELDEYLSKFHSNK
ncbi:MAG: excisionase family DNA-binding protein [Liquorilactobacillus hordei]|uniref:excisionase family DNA-binding protein n=1 Tax=Liquorilactobacillus hordei TaxID=468911 RepID=UPI0039E77279